MKEPLQDNFDNQAKPPCQKKGFDTYLILLAEAAKENRAAYECLGHICKNKVVPSYCRRYYWLRKEDVEEACWDALADFIYRLQAGLHEYNINWLWKKANFRIIDSIRKNNIDTIDIEALEFLIEAESGLTMEEVEKSLGEFVKHLTPDEALLFELHYIGTKTIKEVSEVTGWTNGRISRLKESINLKAKKFFS